MGAAQLGNGIGIAQHACNTRQCFQMIGAGIFLLSINVELGAATLAPAVVIVLFTVALSPWVKAKNAKNLKI